MRSITIPTLAFCASIAAASTAAADVEVHVHDHDDGYIGEGDFGVGVALGDPLGITGKYYFHNDHALSATVGVRPIYYRGYAVGPHASIDWNFEIVDIGPDSGAFELSPYVGAGAHLGLYDHGCFRTVWGTRCTVGTTSSVAIRAPLGLSMKFSPVTLEIYGEAVPALGVLPDPFYLEVSGAVGARYFF